MGNQHHNPDGGNTVHRGLRCGSDWKEDSESWNDRPVYVPTADIVIGRSDHKPTMSVGKSPTAVRKLPTSGRGLSDRHGNLPLNV